MSLKKVIPIFLLVIYSTYPVLGTNTNQCSMGEYIDQGYYNEPNVPRGSIAHGLRHNDFAEALKEEILDDQIFDNLKTTKSNTRRELYLDAPKYKEIYGGIIGTKDYTKKYINMKKAMGNAIQRYADENGLTIEEARKKYIGNSSYEKFILGEGYSNCGDCSIIMTSRLHSKYPDLPIESISNEYHIFTVINRLPFTDLQNPLDWNSDTVIVDAWIQKVYTAREFNGGRTGINNVSIHGSPYTKILEYSNGGLILNFDKD